MFSPEGPTLRELAVQALSSVERGYDLLAPKFDHTPFRTPDAVLDAVAGALAPLGPFEDGLDLCCGTGAGTRVLAGLCQRSVTGVDFSAGMLDVAAARSRDAVVAAGPRLSWVRADARALPFRDAFDLVASFGALGHFLPGELPGLFAGLHTALRPGGRFVLPVLAPPRPTSPAFWTLLGFDAVMRVRNALWRPSFVMYYRAFRLGDVLADLRGAGFDVELTALPGFGNRDDGSPRARLVTAVRPGTPTPPPGV
ncbi:class I SAM-dependent methyltransferase [Streptomyces sp. J2-1]|uniref:class I SAM-dependent methyltransferase n=1 Tax=Streptomyces corallincola TaxID=2851888 RepID=UPI001C392420|nr:class I SAM-dependent methyltransferase [Streptomyces corallincola]MBV2352939.1 class I SAM-dependent methyltransferase [Streptomyces corallincola]